MGKAALDDFRNCRAKRVAPPTGLSKIRFRHQISFGVSFSSLRVIVSMLIYDYARAARSGFAPTRWKRHLYHAPLAGIVRIYFVAFPVALPAPTV